MSGTNQADNSPEAVAARRSEHLRGLEAEADAGDVGAARRLRAERLQDAAVRMRELQANTDHNGRPKGG
jgi:hypothetical protein